MELSRLKARVRTKTVKKASKVIIEKYYTRLTLDFHINKRICEEVAIIPTKKLRNKIAGYVFLSRFFLFATFEIMGSYRVRQPIGGS